MQDLFNNLRRIVAQRTDGVAAAADRIVAELELTDREETYARNMAGKIFGLLVNERFDGNPPAMRARAPVAAALIAFESVSAWAESDESLPDLIDRSV